MCQLLPHYWLLAQTKIFKDCQIFCVFLGVCRGGGVYDEGGLGKRERKEHTRALLYNFF